MEQVHTSVDKLMSLVQERGKISVSEAAKELKLSERAIQAWVDFLVEEHVLGIEYKFTTPYIYVHSEERLQAVKQSAQQQSYTLADFKKAFIKHAREKNMPEERLDQLWKEHLKYMAESQRKYFFDECKNQKVERPDELYQQYVEALMREA